jgi:hypothetical protein
VTREGEKLVMLKVSQDATEAAMRDSYQQSTATARRGIWNSSRWNRAIRWWNGRSSPTTATA